MLYKESFFKSILSTFPFIFRLDIRSLNRIMQLQTMVSLSI